MEDKFSILFSSAGRRVELMQTFRRAAALLGVKVRLLAADAAPGMSAACLDADKYFKVPRCNAPDFIPALLQICEAERVRLVIPTIDTELCLLANHEQDFARHGVLLSISSPEIVAMARNKLETHRFLTAAGVPSPRTGTLPQLRSEIASWKFPIILKRIDGSSSIGIHICRTAGELQKLELPEGSYIAQELWSGEEYTVNIFFDRAGLRCAVPHLRCETRGGEVSKGITRRVPALEPLITKLGTALAGKAFGALCFQAIVTPAKETVVFEINARFGGGYPLADHAGGHFAKWLLEIALGRPSTARNEWRPNIKMLRYDAAVFAEAES